MEHACAQVSLKKAIPFVAPLLLAGATETVAYNIKLDHKSFDAVKLNDEV
jgi:hypothetical protein